MRAGMSVADDVAWTHWLGVCVLCRLAGQHPQRVCAIPLPVQVPPLDPTLEVLDDGGIDSVVARPFAQRMPVNPLAARDQDRLVERLVVTPTNVGG
jgi:hypothetical protein